MRGQRVAQLSGLAEHRVTFAEALEMSRQGIVPLGSFGLTVSECRGYKQRLDAAVEHALGRGRILMPGGGLLR